MQRTAWVVVAPLAATLLVLAGPAGAHPLGNFTVNRYARLEPGRDRLRIAYVVDWAEVPAYQVLQALPDASAPGVAPAGVPVVGTTTAIAAPAAMPVYRYVYQPDRILVVDPYTDFPVQVIPR